MSIAEIRTIQWRDGRVIMIDQRRLPHEEIYLTCSTYQEVAQAIQSMVIRGAPAIGVAAAMGVALGINASSAKNKDDLEKDFLGISERLMATRPTAVNLSWALIRMKRIFKEYFNHPLPALKEAIQKEALTIYEEDIALNRKMAAHGEAFIRDGFRLMTYCNTGTLAAAGYGTALGVIRAAHEAGKRISVYVCETRPFLQGLRLTSWELYKLKIPQTVISDNMAATLMAQKKVDAIFVGADRVAANGDVANKIGTYMLAVLAQHHRVPFYVVAPTSTIDPNCPNGEEIPIEERDPKEVTHLREYPIGLTNVPVFNPAFDVTPAAMVTALITERGVIYKLFKRPHESEINSGYDKDK